ncbi:MAG: GtrA family protein [Oscillospiraceae bacterium]|nr:GtrA family protein [Oscillospiraceae bacterium]
MVTKLKNLYTKHREVISYLFFGGLTTVVSFVSQITASHFFKLHSPDFLGATTLPATTVSWICAVTFAFFVNKIFVFRNAETKKADWFKQAGIFYGSRLTTLAAEIGFLYLTVDVWLGSQYEGLMKIFAQIFIVIGNYFISKFLVFKNKKEDEKKETKKDKK